MNSCFCWLFIYESFRVFKAFVKFWAYWALKITRLWLIYFVSCSVLFVLIHLYRLLFILCIIWSMIASIMSSAIYIRFLLNLFIRLMNSLFFRLTSFIIFFPPEINALNLSIFRNLFLFCLKFFWYMFFISVFFETLIILQNLNT